MRLKLLQCKFRQGKYKWTVISFSTIIFINTMFQVSLVVKYRYFISLIESAAGVVQWLSCWSITMATQVGSLAGETFSHFVFLPFFP